MNTTLKAILALSLPTSADYHTHTHPPLQLLCRPQLLSLWLPALPQPTNATVACYCLHRKTKRPMENSNVYQRCQLLLYCFVRNMSLPDASSLSFNCAASSALAAWCKRCLTQKSESARITSIQNRADRAEKNTPRQNPKQRSLRCGANDPDAPLPSPCLCGLFAGLRFCRSGLQVRYGLQIHAILQTQFTCVLK